MSNQPTHKPVIAIICGGRSGEHEVSLASAHSVLNAIDRDKYDVITIGITREGRWLTQGDPLRQLQGAAENAPASLCPPTSPDAATAPSRELIPGTGNQGIPQLDVIFPLLHGPYGEDGTIQGLFEMADLPYVGCGVLGCAVGMDKTITKALFHDAGLPVVPGLTLLRRRWEQEPEPVLDQVERELGYPCFIKPANMGSSVGITKAHDRAELRAALDLACRFDRKLLVEAAINAREIECSVLGNDQPIASVLGEVVPKREFYDYQAKYLEDTTDLIIPADLPEETSQRMRALAVRAFQVLDCAGLTRVDFFLCKDTGRIYVNEVNTMPGFTSISMYPKLWEASGLPYPALIDRLIELALERFEDKRRNQASM